MKTFLILLLVALSFGASAQTTKDSIQTLLVNTWVADSIAVGNETKYPPEGAIKTGFEIHADKTAKSYESDDKILDAEWEYEADSKSIILTFPEGDKLKLQIDHITKTLLFITVIDEEDPSGVNNFQIYLSATRSLR